jgi:hypothetical protein
VPIAVVAAVAIVAIIVVAHRRLLLPSRAAPARRLPWLE